MKYFKAVTGETFVSYLTRLRVERAMQMLEESDKAIAEIAAAVGFADQSYFDKMFRRYFKRAPRDVRHPPMVLTVGAPARLRRSS
jgi:two-component system response regulator YesN